MYINPVLRGVLGTNLVLKASYLSIMHVPFSISTYLQTPPQSNHVSGVEGRSVYLSGLIS